MDDRLMEIRQRRALEARGAIERRTFSDSGLELRTSAREGTVTVAGYAATFGTVYDVGNFKERVARTALDRTMTELPDVVFNADHGRSLSGLPLARTRSAKGGPGTLRLSTDSTGLYFTAEMDAEDPDVQALARAIRNGNMSACSWCFRVNRDSWDQSMELRTLEDVTIHGGDVSCVSHPANPETSITVRSASTSPIVMPDHTTRAREYVALLRAGRSPAAPTPPRNDPYAARVAELRRA